MGVSSGLKIPRFLDIEASSLSMDSYPIEIAWSDPEGNIKSHLINPYAIEAWTDWDYHAQQVHGISRKQCREEGVHPEWLCRRMCQAIPAGAILYADGGELDAGWIDVLFGINHGLDRAPFRVVHSDVVMIPLLAKIEADPTQLCRLYEKLKREARAIVKERHRAQADVQYLITLWRLCLTANPKIES
jgi:hypothetical protein